MNKLPNDQKYVDPRIKILTKNPVDTTKDEQDDRKRVRFLFVIIKLKAITNEHVQSNIPQTWTLNNKIKIVTNIQENSHQQQEPQEDYKNSQQQHQQNYQNNFNNPTEQKNQKKNGQGQNNWNENESVLLSVGIICSKQNCNKVDKGSIFLRCSHQYHQCCFKDMIKQQAYDKFSLPKCNQKNCGQIIKLASVKGYFSPEQFSELNKAFSKNQLEQIRQENPNIIKCSDLDCNILYYYQKTKGSRFVCQQCSNGVCLKCQKVDNGKAACCNCESLK